MRTKSIADFGRRFVQDESGFISVLNIFLTVSVCAIGAIALDVTHFYAARTHLQVSADIGAHAALFTRRYGVREDRGSGPQYYPYDDAAAKAAAIDLVQYGMPASYGTVVDPDQIVLGNLDWATGQVVPDVTPPLASPDSAVLLTDRSGENPVGSFLFRILGINSMNVSARAVYSLAPGKCDPTQGFFSQTRVEMNGNNTFEPGFCVGAPEVWVRNQNMFRPGVSVVVPTEEDLQLSGSDVQSHNPGLMEALNTDQYDEVAAYTSSEMRLVMTNDGSLPSAFRSHAYAYDLLARPGWTQVVTDRSMTPVPLAGGTTYTPSQLTPNTIYEATCSGNGPSGGITLRDNTTSNTFRNIVILTNCRIDLDGSVKLQDTVISTSRNTGQPSIKAPASMTGLTIGRDDNCDPTGGTALITRGIFDTAAKVNFYGALIRAGDRADFQSNAEGQGVSIIAGNGKVDTNSNITMRACGPAAGTLSKDVSFRLIQ